MEDVPVLKDSVGLRVNVHVFRWFAWQLCTVFIEFAGGTVVLRACRQQKHCQQKHPGTVFNNKTTNQINLLTLMFHAQITRLPIPLSS